MSTWPDEHRCATLLSRWQRTGSARDREALVEAYVPLAEMIMRGIARKVSPHGDDDAHLSAALAGLMRGIDTFDPARGTPLAAWLRLTIAGAVKDEVRKAARRPERVITPAQWEVVEDTTSTEQVVQGREDLRQVMGALRRLPEREQQLLKDGLAGMTVRESSELMGIHESRGSRLRARALGHLADALKAA